MYACFQLQVLYFAFLGYCFVGVAIVADIFMGSIETITSKRREVKMEDGRVRHAKSQIAIHQLYAVVIELLVRVQSFGFESS